ncbi:hypothetical protein ACFOWX_02365 [Sphingorhabdus arenilitoris]|uniref:Secreted protein n=1 Tax=Sphingorhabdus arenilitoris TaxID=1490041 RepID=A0ABV8RD22_9SPHN
MRPIAKFMLSSPLAIVVAMSFAAPVHAQDVIFIPGTGEAAPADDAGSGVPYDNTDPRASSSNEEQLRGVAARLGDPDMQDGIANMAENLGEVMMRLPVGKFMSAIEKARPGTVDRDYDEDTTFADMAGPEAEDLPQQLGQQSRVAVKMMSGFAEAIAQIMPQLEELGRDLDKSMADVKAKSRR